MSISAIRLAIIRHVMFTFTGYLTIGLALAVLPVFIHDQLGFSTMTAGVVISLQYCTTFLFRGYAGGIVDRKGPKPAVTLGLAGFAVSGLLLFAAWLLRGTPWMSLSMLVITRLMTGFGEGLIGASPINWAILVVGDAHTGKAISYNGIASYGALAVGAPLGVVLEGWLGLGSIGILICVIGIVGWILARRREAIKGMAHGARESFLTVFRIVSPYGFTLALGGLGFGAISTFITLYYAHLHWSGAVACLSVFSALFILGRVFFESYIEKYGGMRTAIACLAVETLGLLVIWQAGTSYLTLTGAGIAGLGFSLLFPALGVVAVKAAPPANKGAALGGYGLFIDLSLGITGPLVGAVAGHFGMQYIFGFSMGVVLLGLLFALYLQSRRSTIDLPKFVGHHLRKP